MANAKEFPIFSQKSFFLMSADRDMRYRVVRMTDMKINLKSSTFPNFFFLVNRYKILNTF
jgi:hypothetical protein